MRRERLMGVAVLLGLALLLAAAAAPVAVAAGKTELSVRVSGLPAKAKASVLVRGPHGFERKVTRAGNTKLRLARAGRYRILVRAARFKRAAGGVRRGAIAYPTRKRVAVKVIQRKTTTVAATYGTIVNPGLVRLRGKIVRVIGSPGGPRGLVLAGFRRVPKRGQTVTLAPRDSLPHGVLAKVTSTRKKNGRLVVRLRSVAVTDVVPVLQFDDVKARVANSGRTLRKASCSGSGISPIREINNVRLSGRITALSWKGPGVTLQAHFDVETGVKVTSALGLECSVSGHTVPARVMVPPGIPLYGTFTIGLDAALRAAATLEGRISMPVTLGASSIGAPPLLLWQPIIKPGKPKFVITFERVAELKASAALGADFGIADPDAANVHVSLVNTLAFSAQPDKCSWDLDLGSLSGGGKLGPWTISTPKTPPVFHKNLYRCSAPPAPPPPPPPPSGSYPAAVIADNPISYWPLDETTGSVARDIKATQDGTITGGVTLGQLGPIPGAASMDFDGGYVDLGNNPALQPQQWTIEGWFRSTADSGTGDIYRDIYRNRHHGNGLYISSDISSGQVGAFGCPAFSECYGVASPPGRDYHDGQWHYAVATRDTTSLSLYVDGGLVASTGLPAGTFYEPTGTAIGRGGSCDCNYFKGSIAQVALYDHALSASQVATHLAAAG